MKKLLSLLVVIGIATLISCGPSAKEQVAKVQIQLDSMKNVLKYKEDTCKQVREAILIRNAIQHGMDVEMRNRAKMDSIAHEELMQSKRFH